MNEENHILTIGELTDQLRETLETDFGSVWVSGEISSISRPKSGHIYLTLKDQNAQLSSVIWRGVASRLRFELNEGLEVVCNGGIDIYPPRGSYQLIIRQVEPLGVGELQLAFKQLHEKLSKQGLFDAVHKKPIPRFPRSIAFVTSPSGAAVHDFVQIARRRWPSIPITVIPAKVQGEGSVDDLVAGIRAAHDLTPRPCVLVVGRGGGSLEDLWSFNEEKVVHAIFESEIPIVSAVGHEVDVTLSDLVADQRALTPSEAAERIVPNVIELLGQLDSLQKRLMSLLAGRLQWSSERLERLASNRVMLRPTTRIHELARTLDDTESELIRAIQLKIERAKNGLTHASAQLESLSPLAVLKRGYSVTQSADGNVIRNSNQVRSGDVVTTRLEDGKIKSVVE